MPKNIVAIIQARLGSSRLPLKSLLNLHNAPIIDWVSDRVAKARQISKIIVAVPDSPLDQVLANHLKNRDVACITGPENDVLARYIMAAKAAEADLVVRVCADNPLVWPEAIDRLVRFYQAGDWDYAYNHIPRNNLWPDGLGAEIISRELLEDIEKKTEKSSQREHCLNYIHDNQHKFRIGTFDPQEIWLQRPDIKLDIDSVDDFRRLALLDISKDMEAKDIITAWDKGRS